MPSDREARCWLGRAQSLQVRLPAVILLVRVHFVTSMGAACPVGRISTLPRRSVGVKQPETAECTAESPSCACRHLSLSTNNIDKIAALSGLDNLEILSLGRNQLKKIENVEPVAATLQQLWISYNLIDKLVRPVRPSLTASLVPCSLHQS